MSHTFVMDGPTYRAFQQIIETVDTGWGSEMNDHVSDAVRDEYTKNGDFLVNRINSRFFNIVNANIDNLGYADAADKVVWLHNQWLEILTRGIHPMRKRGVGDPAQMQTLEDMAVEVVKMGLYWAPCRWFVQGQSSSLSSDAERLTKLTDLFDSAVSYTQSQQMDFGSKVSYVSGMRVFTPAHSSNLPSLPEISFA